METRAAAASRDLDALEAELAHLRATLADRKHIVADSKAALIEIEHSVPRKPGSRAAAFIGFVVGIGTAVAAAGVLTILREVMRAAVP